MEWKLCSKWKFCLQERVKNTIDPAPSWWISPQLQCINDAVSHQTFLMCKNRQKGYSHSNHWFVGWPYIQHIHLRLQVKGPIHPRDIHKKRKKQSKRRRYRNSKKNIPLIIHYKRPSLHCWNVGHTNIVGQSSWAVNGVHLWRWKSTNKAEQESCITDTSLNLLIWVCRHDSLP